jgi:prepilin-type N-terminal cleavage/methylation domain-containing protein
MNRIRKNRAFTLVEIMIVVLIIGILMAIAVPQFVNARTQSQQSSCIANLKEIESAKEQWAMETAQAAAATPAWADLLNTSNPSAGYLKAEPNCPSGGTYTIGPLTTAPTCSVSNHVLASG